MIKVHRLGGQALVINAELIENVQAVPNTLIVLATGNRYIVRETVEEVGALVRDYRRAVNSENQGISQRRHCD